MSLSRRHFLKSAGITIALPFMPSLPLLGQTKWTHSSLKKRMVFVSTGLGMYPGAFFPKGFGQAFDPSPSLRPMMKHLGDFTVFSNMDHPNVRGGHGGLSHFLNGGDFGRVKSNRIATVDQVAATAMGYETRFPSLHLSLGGKGSPSITTSGTQKRVEGTPQQLFGKLFVEDSDAAKRALAKDIEEQGSILDLIREQARSIGNQVNHKDREKLDEYLTAIRDAERKLQGMKKWQHVDKPKVDSAVVEVDRKKAKSDDNSFDTEASMMFDLVHLAIESDSSRIFTISFGMHNRRIDLDGVNSGYHSLSHHGRRPDKLKQLEVLESNYVTQVSRLMDRLKESGSEGGNLLDETMILFGSALSDAARHSNRDLPIMLAGGGFQHKGHVDMQQTVNKNATPLNNLYTSMLQNFGLEVEKYNSATGDLNHILT
ncbi:MAG: DUF1552 domain-containing protein [Roseibacillus sp.]